ncbi:MAG TPA: hypothetical protein VNS88_00150 [Nitrospiraceae bacterium]|nr:hypothetical protein [Nitrospiraceae bacterium]
MSGLTKGPMPDVTPPQIVGLAIAGIPIIAQLLRAFGIYDLDADQQQALSDTVTWATVAGGSLIGGDALLRTGRNLRRGNVEAAVVNAQVANGVTPNTVLLPPEKGAPEGTTFRGGAGTSPTAGFEDPPPTTP